MKFSFNLKNKEANFEADIEGIVNKRFQHKEKISNPKTRYQIKQEEKRKNEELKQQQLVQFVLLMIGIILFFFVICTIGSFLDK